MYCPANVFLTTGPVPVRILCKAELLQQPKLRVQHQNHLAVGVWWEQWEGCAQALNGAGECIFWEMVITSHALVLLALCLPVFPQPDPLGKFGIKSPFFFLLSFLFDLSLVLHWCWQQLHYAKVIPCIKWWQLCLFLWKLLALQGLILNVQASDEGIPHLRGTRPAFGLVTCDQLCLLSHTWSQKMIGEFQHIPRRSVIPAFFRYCLEVNW